MADMYYVPQGCVEVGELLEGHVVDNDSPPWRWTGYIKRNLTRADRGSSRQWQRDLEVWVNPSMKEKEG